MLSQGSNDVACATQMMLCLAAQMKKSKSFDLDFLCRVSDLDAKLCVADLDAR